MIINTIFKYQIIKFKNKDYQLFITNLKII